MTPGTDEWTSFDPNDVRGRLPAEASDRQERALICAVRNPDATPYEIGHAAGVEHGEVVRALSGLAHGTLGTTDEGRAQAKERRGEARVAENYAELTDRQRAIVDWRARHDPEFEQSGAAVARAINQDDTYDVNLDETTVPSFENDDPYDDRLDGLVAERRDILLAQGDLDDDEQEQAAAAHRLDTRDYLDLAGYDLPEMNLDDLDTVGDGLPEDVLLDMAYENGQADDEDADPSCVVSEFENHLDDDAFDDEDVQVGTGYVGVVNGVVEWGVWITIAGDPDLPSDVSGVLPVESLKPHGMTPDAFDEGDEVRVVAAGRSNTDDGKVRHRFDVPIDPERLPDEDAGEGEGGSAFVRASDLKPAEDEARDETLENYWKQVALVRYLRTRLNRENVDKFEAHDSPLAREYHMAVARKHDLKESVHVEDCESLPVYRNRHETPAWDYRVETLRNGDEVFVPADYAVPEDADGERVAVLHEQVEAMQTEVERLAEQVDENAEALPTGDEARELNEAATEVQNTYDELDDLRSTVESINEFMLELYDAESDDLPDGPPATFDDVFDRLDALERTAPTREAVEGIADRVERLAERGTAQYDDARAQFVQATLDDYTNRETWGVRDVELDAEGRHGSTATLTVTFEDTS